MARTPMAPQQRRTGVPAELQPPDDAAIRAALTERIRLRFRGRTRVSVIEELGLREGRARVDLAVVTDTLHGYEIKSDRDNRRRLRRQALIYGTVCDRMTLVAGQRAARWATRQAPDWWEIIEAVPRPAGRPRLRQVRRGRINRDRNPRALIELLWRVETLRLLLEHDIERGVVSKPRAVMWDRAIDSLPTRTVVSAVMAALHDRDYRRDRGGTRRIHLDAERKSNLCPPRKR